jgi:hypothetical protein
LISARLYIWVPSSGNMRGCWVRAAIPGTAWDADYWRTIYRARGFCTAYVKANLGCLVA